MTNREACAEDYELLKRACAADFAPPVGQYSILRHACDELITHIEDTRPTFSQPSPRWCDKGTKAIEAWFPNYPRATEYAKHLITVRQTAGKLVIKTWVVRAGEGDLEPVEVYLEPVEVTHADAFVPALLAIRAKVTKEAVRSAV